MITNAHLVADIGGTHARFAIASNDRGAITLAHQGKLKAAAYATFEDATAAYLASIPIRPSRATLAVAGPITEDPIVLTNSPWRIDAQALCQRFEWRSLSVVNDFAAQARGAMSVPAEDRVPIIDAPGEDFAPRVVLGPGTGLGLGIVRPSGDDFYVQATEAGHISFAPQNAREMAVLAHYRETHDYASFETFISGRGIETIFTSLYHLRGEKAPLLSAAEISAHAESDPVARETLEMFFAALGTFAGDAVLMTGARGGVYIGGGIAPKLQHHLLKSDFKSRFRSRGPMSAYLADVPVYLLTSDDTALIGAAALTPEQT